jgi:hypothetical protein
MYRKSQNNSDYKAIKSFHLKNSFLAILWNNIKNIIPSTIISINNILLSTSKKPNETKPNRPVKK